MGNYCEFSFVLPIDDLLDERDDVPGKELISVCEIIGIKINTELLQEKYNSYGIGLKRCGKGDVLVFYNNTDPDKFISLDLYNGCTDQNNMVELGVRCPLYKSTKVKEVLTELYNKGGPRSKFIELIGDKLKNEIAGENFPKSILDCMGIYNQRIEYYVDGVWQRTIE